MKHVSRGIVNLMGLVIRLPISDILVEIYIVPYPCISSSSNFSSNVSFLSSLNPRTDNDVQIQSPCVGPGYALVPKKQEAGTKVGKLNEIDLNECLPRGENVDSVGN